MLSTAATDGSCFSASAFRVTSSWEPAISSPNSTDRFVLWKILCTQATDSTPSACKWRRLKSAPTLPKANRDTPARRALAMRVAHGARYKGAT